MPRSVKRGKRSEPAWRNRFDRGQVYRDLQDTDFIPVLKSFEKVKQERTQKLKDAVKEERWRSHQSKCRSC